jgi:pyruvate dehydrogenase E2 component (dihydrolipoyllysine-residue acetyltransferase)
MDVLMPQLGETVAEGKISKWFVSAGDSVKPGDNLFEIETDKVSMEVPAIAAGTLSEIRVAAGETAPVGAVVGIILAASEKAPSSPPLIPAQAGIHKELGPRFRGDERMVEAVATKPAIQLDPFREVRTPERNYGPARLTGGITVTPLARRLAGEAGIDLTSLKGSGPRGRIMACDVETAREVPAPAQAQAVANVVLSADVALGQSLALCADVRAIELADVIIKAWAMALQRALPSEQSVIALAIGKDRAVIRGAEGRSLTAISAARRDPGAADGKQSASTAISIPGISGITSIADVLQPPHTTMLSVGAARRAPVETEDGGVRFVSVMTVMLTCDHRVVDGARGAALLAAFKGFVEQPVTMIV